MRNLPSVAVYSLLLLASAVFTSECFGQEGEPEVTRADFNTAYRAFQEASESNNQENLYDLAVEALRIGEQLFGDESKSVAALTMNAALAFPSLVFTNRADAEPLMRKLVRRYLNVYGDESIELGEPYTLLAEALYRAYRLGSIDAAREINAITAKVQALARKFPGQLNWEALLIRLIRLQANAQSKKTSERILESARKEFGEDHEITLRWEYVVARNFTSGRKRERKYLDLVDHPNFDPLLRFGVLQDLEQKGPRKRREEFKRRIANFTVEADTRYAAFEMLPRVKVAPRYPRKALNRGLAGWVIVEFEVTPKGQTASPVVVDSCVKPTEAVDCLPHVADLFNEPAIEAVEQFLYIPRFVEGKPVSTKGVQNRLLFELMTP